MVLIAAEHNFDFPAFDDFDNQYVLIEEGAGRKGGDINSFAQFEHVTEVFIEF